MGEKRKETRETSETSEAAKATTAHETVIFRTVHTNTDATHIHTHTVYTIPKQSTLDVDAVCVLNAKNGSCRSCYYCPFCFCCCCCCYYLTCAHLFKRLAYTAIHVVHKQTRANTQRDPHTHTHAHTPIERRIGALPTHREVKLLCSAKWPGELQHEAALRTYYLTLEMGA